MVVKKDTKKVVKKTTKKIPKKTINKSKKIDKGFKIGNTSDINQFFFGKSLNVNQLLNKAVNDLLYQIFIQNADVQAGIRDKNNLSFLYGYYFKNISGEKIKNENEIKELNSILYNIQKFKDFKKEFNYYRNVFGNVYTYLLRNEKGQIVGLQNLDPREVVEVEDENYGILLGYNYNKQFISKENIVHFKNGFNFNAKLKGFSPLSGGILDLLADNEAARSNFMFFLNGTIPSGLVKFKEGTSDEEIKMYIDALIENYSGGNNAHKIGGMKNVEGFEKLAKEFKDMEFNILRNFSTEKVATCLGIPVTRLNKVNATYNNMGESYNQYIESTIIPENEDLKDHLNEIYYKIYEGKYTIEYNDNYIDNKEYILKNGILQIENGITTPAKVAEELGYDITDKELQNKLYLKSGLIGMEDAGIQGFNQNDLNEQP